MWELINVDIPAVIHVQLSAPELRDLGKVALSVVGGNLAESFCERMISAANVVVYDRNTSLGNDLIE